ncbi:hypothetical protein QDW19_gp37 [Microbacterium phage AvGardian]|uniref:hypothetical protein n=1 Tax=Microbacterium phage AvGardian TaxID=2725619 RepID=UPI001464347A|nr:hypothetical protein QDW19_gp37 [Microbacterium phage AvGardian]QJD49852.1 hypothetical protein SEA_AVGARDIAN_37 [Microbacterium phage AvGardian]
MNSNERDYEIGTIDPRLDVKVGDLVSVRIGVGQYREDKSVYEIPVIQTFKVESVDVLGKDNLWCRGTIVETDYHTPEVYIGTPSMAYLGKVTKG